MVDPDRRPTAQEIEELIDLVRRDPSSPAFIDLGEAYLNLGRPKDTIGVCNLGLEASPDNLEGRVMLARAHAQLHQWKEAQGELLRVVKVDRSNRGGFALLGEVLLRRNDYERAVPVLQHAQNLDPTSPAILAMLKRARANQALDPPPAQPTPVPPRGETSYGMKSAPPAQPPPRRPGPPSAPPPMRGVPVASPQMATLAVEPPPPKPKSRVMPIAAPDSQTYDPTATPPQMQAPVPPPPRGPKPTAPPPMSVEGVRPRVISAARPQNAAAASLRQSAAVGESYLNDLLTGGLLDVAGVRVPDVDFDLRPDRRWGRSQRRAFIFLFVVLVLGIGGGGTWYWWSEKKKDEAIARYQKETEAAIVLGDYAGFRTAEDKVTAAAKLDDKNLLTLAYSVEINGLQALLYGTFSPDGPAEAADKVLKKIGKDIPDDGPGSRQLLIGRAALDLSRLHALDKGVASDKLSEVEKSLDTYLAKHEDDRWARWLKGRAELAAGLRRDGRATITRAATGDDGLVVAQIDEADAFVDDGHLDKALPIYNDVLKRAKDHPLAVLGRALGRAEGGIDTDAALGELKDAFVDGKTPQRVTAYRALARSLGNLATESYGTATEGLLTAVAAGDPAIKLSTPQPLLALGDERFWARIAWIYYVKGNLNAANESVKYVRFYGKKDPEDYPPVMLLVAADSLANGLPDRALDLASKIEGVRAKLIRTQAYIDLAQYPEAIKEADEVTKLAPDNNDALVLHEEAKMLGSAKDSKDRTDAANALVGLSRKLKTKLPSHALGYAYMTLGNAADAKEAFTKALADISDDAPNPVAYRTETGLAQLAFAAGNIAEAGQHLDNALQLNKKYFFARALQAKLVLRNGEPDRALKYIEQLIKDTNGGAGAGAADLQLTAAEAMVTRKDATPADKDKAKEMLKAIKDKVQPPTEVGRVAALIDPKLPEELGVPVPEPTAPDGAKPPKKTPKHR